MPHSSHSPLRPRVPRKGITIMEASLEWPRFDARTLFGIVRRQIRNALRRRRFLREDRAE